MATINLNNEQLRLIQHALDLYSRVGTLQLEVLLDHPSIDSIIDNKCTIKKDKLEVGDNTMRGKIIEIGDDYIKTKGTWGNNEEIKTWKDTDKIKLAPDWDKIHTIRDQVSVNISEIKKSILGEVYGRGANLGIYNPTVDESCRVAYDMIQVIRHEFWKENSTRSNMTVDSSTNLSHPENTISVKLDDIKDIRKRKLKNLEK
jgi:hypothetical protein